MNTFLQFNTLFLSILIEALPFILIGVMLSGIIQIFVSEDMVSRILPKNKYLSVILGAMVGIVFPSCECGIVLIVRRLMRKGVPLHAAIPFMLTAPIINPVVLFATYVAFGNSWVMVGYRAGLAFVVAVLTGWIISVLIKDNPLKEKPAIHEHHHLSEKRLAPRLVSTVRHATDDFFYICKFLILGAFITSVVQVWVPTSTLLSIGHGKYASTSIMMLLSYVLSLCSEADAFIASSFRNTFLPGSLTAFLVFGAMLDVKNTLMLFSAFKARFVGVLIVLVTVFVWLGGVWIGG